MEGRFIGGRGGKQKPREETTKRAGLKGEQEAWLVAEEKGKVTKPPTLNGRRRGEQKWVNSTSSPFFFFAREGEGVFTHMKEGFDNGLQSMS